MKPDQKIKKKVTELGFTSLKNYIGNRADWTFQEMAEELEVPIAILREHHSQIIQEKMQHEA